MALPFPCDRPIVPTLYYDSQHPPYRPNIDVPDELIFARDYICTQIANMAGLLAGMNPGRMFLYNTLVFQNFDNDDFREVYRLVCGLILFRQRRGNLNDIRMSANECIHQVLSLYVAYLCNNYPDLMKQLDVNQLQSVRDSTVPFQDLKAMVQSVLTDPDRSKYLDRATDIVFKCKDLYTLNSQQLLEDCRFTHDAMQRHPFQAKQYSNRYIFNPTDTKPLIPPRDFKLESVILPEHTPQQPLINKQEDQVMYPNQFQQHVPPGMPQTIMGDQPPRQLTPHEQQFGLPVPRTDQEARMITNGFDMNFPELGYFPSWHPRHLDWLNAQESKNKEIRDRVALDNHQKYGTPLPPHLQQQRQGSSMQYNHNQQQYYPPMQGPQGFQQPVGGYHNFQPQQPPPSNFQTPQVRFGSPNPQTFGQSQQVQSPQGFYTPDVAVIQVLAMYPDGSRMVVDRFGQQIFQQFVVQPNLQVAMTGNAPVRFMHPQAPAPEQYDHISPALRTSMDRFDKRPSSNVKPSFTGGIRSPDCVVTGRQEHRAERPVVESAPTNDNYSYFRRGAVQQPTQTPEPMVTGRNRQFYQEPEVLASRIKQRQVADNQSDAADEWANHLISHVCTEEEQLDIRNYAINPNAPGFNGEVYHKSPQTVSFESQMNTGLPFETVPRSQIIREQVRPQAKLKTYESHPKDFRTRKQLTFKGANEVDRSKHQIERFGGVVRYPLQPKFDELKESAERLAIAPAVAIVPEPITDKITGENGEEQVVVIEQPPIPIEDYMIHPELLMDPSLDAAAMTSRVLKLEHAAKEPNDKVFRSFGVSCELLLSNSDIEDHVNYLRHSQNFGHLVANLKKIVNGQFETAQEKADVLLVMTEIDRKLTEKTNEFLNYKLGIPATIDEFSSDITDLRAWLLQKYQNPAYGEAFDRFEVEMISSVRDDISAEDLQGMKDSYRVNDDVYASYFPFTYSFTHINLTADELGFSDKDFRDSSIQITEQQHSSLYKLIHSLDMNKFAKKVNTVTDYLVTADGVRYRVFINYVDDTIFCIAREIDG